jgi:cytochrome c peroxidase
VPERAGTEREDPGTTGQFDFRTPSLRNLSLTAPYMHNGVFATLEEAVAFYDDLSRDRAQVLHGSVALEDVAPDARALTLDRGQIDEIVAFLHALTDEGFDRSRPSSVPSGLPPGGL